jgi:hypothetical protein
MHKLKSKTIIIIKDIENHSHSRRCIHLHKAISTSIEIKDPKRGTSRMFVLSLYQTLNLDDMCFPNIHSIAINLSEEDKMYQKC